MFERHGMDMEWNGRGGEGGPESERWREGGREDGRSEDEDEDDEGWMDG